MENYKVDNSNDDITIEVKVSTQGIVSTRVNQRRPSASFDVITKSTEPPNSNAKGRIIEKRIGQAKAVFGQEIQVDTIIRLDLIPETNWPTAFDNLSIEYILRGGVDGTIVFKITDDEKEKTTSGKLIRATKEIKFTN
ncbi:MAG: hypothetical protein IM449_16935 [Microcystis sp. M065S1]|jgi:hypothetical protein|nr:hypothetical protein [Microcystis sp. M065S1]